MTKHKKVVLLIGSSGFIGSYINKSINSKKFSLLTPTSKEFNIDDEKEIEKYFKRNAFDTVINCSGYADMFEAEQDRGNKLGKAYVINTVAPGLLAFVANKYNKYLIHLSTDAVFSGTNEFRGPYSEKTEPQENSKNLSWYALTKLWGEKNILKNCNDSTIVRISYPFGYPQHPKDYLVKTAKNIEKGTGLFYNFHFTPTYLPNITSSLEQMIDKKIPGIFHIVTHPVTTPYIFGKYLNNKFGNTNKIPKTSIHAFLKIEEQPKRNIYGGLLASYTEKKLKIKFSDWKEAINELFKNNQILSK